MEVENNAKGRLSYNKDECFVAIDESIELDNTIVHKHIIF